MAFGAFSILVPKYRFSEKDLVVGHNDFKYKVDKHWSKAQAKINPVKDCHEMIQDKSGRIILLTNHTANNLMYYDTSGQLLKVACSEYPGAHGLTYSLEGGEEFLYLADNDRHAVFKLDIEGNLIFEFPFPESEYYKDKNKYIPTETAIASNGDVFVADGYGSQYIVHYNAEGELLNIFGGSGKEEDLFFNAHGIAIDARRGKEELMITARAKNEFKRYSLKGNYIETYSHPGLYVCRPVIKDDFMYSATIWSGDGSANTGFVSIFDKDHKIVSMPGGIYPKYKDGIVKNARQSINLFQHPHDVCVDTDDNLYIPQWNSGQSYPIKLIRI